MFSTVGGYHHKCGDNVSTVGVFSTVGDILSTVGDVQYRRGYRDTCGEYHEYRGGNNLLLEYLHGTEHPPHVS